MGIKHINDLLNKHNSVFTTIVPFSNFTGKTVVIDISLYICRFKVIHKTDLLFEEAFINLFSVLKASDINIVVVFDGISPKEKSDEREKRRKKRQYTYNKIEALETEVQEYLKSKQIGPIMDTLIQKQNTSIILNKNNAQISIKRIQDYISKQRSYLFKITDKDFETVKKLCDIFGIPTMNAPGEAELFCAYLVKQGLADAVLTKDTDVLACSTPIIISEFNISTNTFSVIEMEKVLQCLKLTEAEMLDLCILCGTDYNTNIRGIGPVKAYALIQKYKTLEEIEQREKNLNLSILNYKTTRKLFACPESFPCAIPNNTEINTCKLREYILNSKCKLPMLIASKFDFDLPL